MTRMITGFTDRLVGALVPKAQARAASCDILFCYCKGVYLYQRKRCLRVDGTYEWGPCNIVTKGAC
ncbi:hypothetical protein ABZ917_03745 [Nonomuraea wenchangensis]|uniref:Uncharacterized protein n=1 Tax=Nonomuraea wenchangensis TaxID=568860 RepID=A0A1I0L2S6_9ACTN|nr:hypothetical protein [Nonomuraea wenchangensis]SEU32991.1 hypothetical protein SAMN05421811_111105 [Nonomuraea wenchangensis]